MDIEKLRDSIIVLENEINRIFELDQLLEKLNHLLENLSKLAFPYASNHEISFQQAT